MTRLILKGVVLIVAVVLTCAATIVILPDPSNTYFRIAATKWEIADTTRSPKMLIVGGSNTAFGIDSDLITRELGMPVVNMGLNAGFGLRYVLAEAEPYVRSGDVVLISPEYEQFYGNLLDGRVQLLELAWLHPAALRHVDTPGQMLSIARGFPHVIQDRLRSMWLDYRSPGRAVYDEVYNVEGFNAHGDVISHLSLASRVKLEQMSFLDDESERLNPDAIEALNDFQAEMNRRGARVLIVLPTIPEEQYKLRADRVQAVYKALEEDGQVPVLAPPQEHTAPLDHFFDTAYHMTGAGRAERTAKLVNLLRTAGFEPTARDR